MRKALDWALWSVGVVLTTAWFAACAVALGAVCYAMLRLLTVGYDFAVWVLP